MTAPLYSATLRSMTGKEVRAIRQRLGLTQSELADKVGVARNTVTRWELDMMGVRESAAASEAYGCFESKEK